MNSDADNKVVSVLDEKIEAGAACSAIGLVFKTNSSSNLADVSLTVTHLSQGAEASAEGCIDARAADYSQIKAN